MSDDNSKADLKENSTKDQVEKSKESIGKDVSAPSSTPSASAVYDIVTGWFFYSFLLEYFFLTLPFNLHMYFVEVIFKVVPFF